MSSPTSAITRLDLSFTYNEFNIAANLGKFIGLQVLPALGVEQESAEFAKIVIASLLGKVEDTERKAKSTYARDDWEWSKDIYGVKEHGVEEVVDDATVEKYGDVIRTEQVAAIRAINRVLQRLEFDIAAAVFNTTTWTGSDLTTALGTAWTVKATADPVADIDSAHDKVTDGCGEDANTLVVSKKAFRAMVRTVRLESLLKYDSSQLLLAMSNNQNNKMVTEVMSGLRDLLQVEQILIGRGIKNTADKGQTPALSRFWDETMASLCVVHDDGIEGDLENPQPQLGRTIFSTKNDEPLPGSDDAGLGSLLFDEYRDEPVRGSVLRPRNKRQVKILHKECAHLLTNVTA